MAHYMIGLMHVTDPEGWSANVEQYVRMVKPVVARFGGEFVFEGRVIETVEGPIEANGGAVIRFPDEDAAMGWFNSPEYAEARRFRSAYGVGNHVLMRELTTEGDPVPVVTVNMWEEMLDPAKEEKVIHDMTEVMIDLLGEGARPFVTVMIVSTPRRRWATGGVRTSEEFGVDKLRETVGRMFDPESSAA